MITTALTRSAGEIRALVKRRPYQLSGKVIVITGGAGGIGSEMARRCAAGGSSVIVVDLDEDRCQDVVDALPPSRSGTAGHLGVPLDLTDREQIAELVRRVDAHAGRIDVLVNNAGMTSAERFGDRSLDSMEEEIRLNTLSPLFVTRLALDLLRKSPDPRVINTVSLAGMFPEAETPIYCASKFALRGAMLSIAMDFKSDDVVKGGIKVSSVLPSATDTRMLRREAIEGGNLLQFQNPPQSAGPGGRHDDVAAGSPTTRGLPAAGRGTSRESHDGLSQPVVRVAPVLRGQGRIRSQGLSGRAPGARRHRRDRHRV